VRDIRLVGAFLLGVASYIFLALSLAHALDVPPLRGRINDYAAVLSSDRAQALESRLAAFEKETGHQIAVLTVPSLEGDALEDFSTRVAQSWKLGKKGFDNGAILLIAQKDRKLRIEVGYGLEGVMPDAVANRIVQEVIVPRFRENDYSGGIEAGLDAVMKVTQGEKLSGKTRPSSKRKFSNISVFGTVLIMAATLAFFIGLTQRAFRRGTLGGATAGFLTTLGLAPGFSVILWVLAVLVGSVLGAVGSSIARDSWGGQWTGGSRRYRDDWSGTIFRGGFG